MKTKNMTPGYTFAIKPLAFDNIFAFFEKHAVLILTIWLTVISIISFIFYYKDGLGVAYNDARSHLDIGRRVVENLKPGFGQLGSVWLPLPHLLMVLTIWNDFMWHSGLAGALQSMISFVSTGVLIYLFLRKMNVGLFGRLVGVFIFAANINILYLQSTAMTELLLLATMTAGAYELMKWHEDNQLFTLLKAAFWVMLSTLVRYDGWFLFLFAVGLIVFHTWKKKGYKTTEGVTLLFVTLAGFGIFLWFFWNQIIFKDPLYFAFGPYSAHTQQQQLEAAGNLATKGNMILSTQMYLYALAYNAGAFTLIMGAIGALMLWFDKKIRFDLRFGSLVLLAPLVFNIVALYLGHSVLYIQGISGNTWFNVRYGVMMLPSIAIYIGFLVDRTKSVRFALAGLLIFVTAFAFISHDAVTIDDARLGASGKNVSEVSGWLNTHAKDQKGYVLISAASHDAIIFSSGLPMSRFIHEGTGKYWDNATTHPDHWARWVVMRTHDTNDNTFRLIGHNPALAKYRLVRSFPFADIYEIKPEYLSSVITQPLLVQK